MFWLLGCVVFRDYVSFIFFIFFEGVRVWIFGVIMFVFFVGFVGWRFFVSGFWGILIFFENCNGVGLCLFLGGKYKGLMLKFFFDCFFLVLGFLKFVRFFFVFVFEWRVGGFIWGLMWCVVFVVDFGLKGVLCFIVSVFKDWVLFWSVYVVFFGVLFGFVFWCLFFIFLFIVFISLIFVMLGFVEVGI